MKILPFLLFITLLFPASKAISQQDVLEKIIGEWNYKGVDVEGTFYQTNRWNKEQLSFEKGFQFRHTISSYIDHQLITQTINGSWSLSNDSTHLILFYDHNRFIKDLQIKTIYNSVEIYFLNEHFFVGKTQSNGLNYLKRYEKSTSVNVDFEEDYYAYQIELKNKDKILDENQYLSIANQDSLIKKYKYAFYTFVSDELITSPFRRTIKTINGKVQNIGSNSITVQPRFSYVKTHHGNSNTSSAVKFLTRKDAAQEISTKNLSYLYSPTASIGMEVSAYFTIASIATTLIATPIVAIASSPEKRNKNTLITAGTGIIGIGIGTGSFFIFRSLRVKFNKDSKKGTSLAPIYHTKEQK